MKLLAILVLGSVVAATSAQRLSDQIIDSLARSQSRQLMTPQARQDAPVVELQGD